MVPEAPVTMDLGGGAAEFGFTLGGVMGVHAAAMNGRYELVQPGVFENASGVQILLESLNFWIFQTADYAVPFMGGGVWPWLITEWYFGEGAEGVPIFLMAPSPVNIDLGSALAVTVAELATNLTGSANDLTFRSRVSGRLGNAVRMRYVNPGVNNAALGVVVNERDITVNLATNGSGQITTTSLQVDNAIKTSAGANALVEVLRPDGGMGVVTAMGWTNLSGGAGGLPLPPGVLSL